MKNIKPDVDDSLRQEYSRSDFGKMVQGKFAVSEFEFAPLVELLIACVGEDEGLTIILEGSNQTGHSSGEWSYELDNASQITLRYWVSEFKNIEEQISNPSSVNSANESANLQTLIQKHVQILKSRVRRNESGT